MASEKTGIYLLLGVLCFFVAPFMGASALSLYQASATLFNSFLVEWIETIFYILTVIMLSLGLSSLDL